MLAFLLSPILALFSVRLYRNVLRSGAGQGFSYLLYLTFLFCLLAFFLCQFLLLPITKSFSDWLVQVTPEMTLTESGLKAKVTEPYLVKHPVLGAVYLIDTTKTLEELLADKHHAILLIGKEYMIGQNPYSNQAPRVIDLKKAMEQVRQAQRPIQITKPLMRQLANRLIAMVIPILLLFLAPMFFVWKLLVALFYSLIALVFNLFRKEKFPYRSLFTLACYAISPVTLIQAFSISAPGFTINLNPPLAVALTASYLIYGMFVPSRNPS